MLKLVWQRPWNKMFLFHVLYGPWWRPQAKMHWSHNWVVLHTRAALYDTNQLQIILIVICNIIRNDHFWIRIYLGPEHIHARTLLKLKELLFWQKVIAYLEGTLSYSETHQIWQSHQSWRKFMCIMVRGGGQAKMAGPRPLNRGPNCRFHRSPWKSVDI